MPRAGNNANHPITLADGRNLAPGDAFDDVDVEANADLVASGLLAVAEESVEEPPAAPQWQTSTVVEEPEVEEPPAAPTEA